MMLMFPNLKLGSSSLNLHNCLIRPACRRAAIVWAAFLSLYSCSLYCLITQSYACFNIISLFIQNKIIKIEVYKFQSSALKTSISSTEYCSSRLEKKSDKRFRIIKNKLHVISEK
jgi:hypothetical protein